MVVKSDGGDLKSQVRLPVHQKATAESPPATTQIPHFVAVVVVADQTLPS